ncbi:MAG: Crp/Fnr family transcriptional regulator, partial [Halobacteriales archaeon]|nr:Crp/Fnr family transcriptional regulator [Halobacteriales archaeon]
HFEKDDRLIGPLDEADRLFLLVEGLASLEAVSVNGIRRILWVYRPCELVGSRSLLDEKVDDTEVRALTDGTAATIATSELERVVEDHPQIAMVVARTLTERLSGMSDRLAEITTSAVPVRLARVLLRMAGEDSGDPRNFRPLEYPMTHETLSEIVGASRPHISATLGHLEEAGAVRRERAGKLTVRPATLKRIADGETEAV